MKIKIGECFDIHDYVNWRNRNNPDVQSYVLVKAARRKYADRTQTHIIGRIWRLSQNSYRFAVSSPSRLRHKGPVVGRATTPDQAVQKAVHAFRRANSL